MVVARFSPFAFLAMQAGLLGLTFGIWWLVLGGVHDRYGAPAAQDPLTWFYCLVSPFFLWLAFVQARQFLFAGRRAVWIENGTLRFFPRAGLRPVAVVPLTGITGFSASTHETRLWVRLRVIRVETTDRNRDDDFLTRPLSESRDVVLARLNPDPGGRTPLIFRHS